VGPSGRLFRRSGRVPIALQLEVLRSCQRGRVTDRSLHALLEKSGTDVDRQSHHAKQDEHQQSGEDEYLAARPLAP
jgi:hypothetical protein